MFLFFDVVRPKYAHMISLPSAYFSALTPGREIRNVFKKNDWSLLLDKVISSSGSSGGDNATLQPMESGSRGVCAPNKQKKNDA